MTRKSVPRSSTAPSTLRYQHFGERAKGRTGYEAKFLPRIGPFSMYGLLLTIVILFAQRATRSSATRWTWPAPRCRCWRTSLLRCAQTAGRLVAAHRARVRRDPVARTAGQLPAIAGPAGPEAAVAADPGIVFSNPVAADGIAAWPGDPDKNPDQAAPSRLGVPCWQTSAELNDQYIYLNIDSARIPAGATDAVLTVNYFDASGQQLTAQYDSVSAPFTPLPWFVFPGTGTWATTQFRMSNINFQNRANGADIRLMANAPGGVIGSICISSVSVSFADTTGITVTNQSLVFTLGSGSVSLTSTASSVGWSVTDDQYLPVASGNAPVSGGAGSISVSSLGPGFYNLRLTAGETVVGTTFAVIPPLPPGTQSPQGKWGVNTHMNHYYPLSGALIRTLALAGFSHIRDSLEWGHLESGSPGNYAVEPQYDAMIADAKANGIFPLLVTGYRNSLYDGGTSPRPSPDCGRTWPRH
jgi:hypothetical protein